MLLVSGQINSKMGREGFYALPPSGAIPPKSEAVVSIHKGDAAASLERPSTTSDAHQRAGWWSELSDSERGSLDEFLSAKK